MVIFKYATVLSTTTDLIPHITEVPYFAVQVLNCLQCCISGVTELIRIYCQNRGASDYLNDFVMITFCYPASLYMSKYHHHHHTLLYHLHTHIITLFFKGPMLEGWWLRVLYILARLNPRLRVQFCLYMDIMGVCVFLWCPVRREYTHETS
jgi:hypothetical protein